MQQYSNESKVDVDDEFWQIELEGNERKLVSDPSDEDDSGESSVAANPGQASKVQLQFEGYPPLSLRLCSLPLNDGVWSSLGAQAWFGSALLASLLLRSTKHDESSCIQQHVESFDQVFALELGSGAVGLSGLALGWMLRHRERPSVDVPGDCIVLTDNDPTVLNQLRANVEFNLQHVNKKLLDTDSGAMPEYKVQHLDWKDGYGSKMLLDFKTHHKRPHLQLVIGSELVYSTETAEACAHVTKSILVSNPNVLIVLIQVADRDGWSNVFLPTISSIKGVCVQEMPILDAEIHEKAIQLVQHGGTLDRFDFALCLISNKPEAHG